MNRDESGKWRPLASVIRHFLASMDSDETKLERTFPYFPCEPDEDCPCEACLNFMSGTDICKYAHFTRAVKITLERENDRKRQRFE